MKKSFLTICFTVICMLWLASDVKAGYIYDSEHDIRYINSVTVPSIGYAQDFAQGGSATSYINIGNKGDRITNVVSSSSNLRVKKTQEHYVRTTDFLWDEETAQKITETSTHYYSVYLSYFAKKPGKYTVSFDVTDASGNLRCTKTIKVTVPKSASKTFTAIKSIKYAGKELWRYAPYTAKTKGKLSVKTKSGYSLVSIKIGKMNSRGKMKYSKVKNNRTIKLATKSKYVITEEDSDDRVTTVTPLFPATEICITVKEKATKEIFTQTFTLYTLSK